MRIAINNRFVTSFTPRNINVLVPSIPHNTKQYAYFLRDLSIDFIVPVSGLFCSCATLFMTSSDFLLSVLPFPGL